MAFCAAYDEGVGVDEENPLLPNLPDDLAIHCLLRVPRLLHGLLRCVCRRWRRLLASPTFFDLRASQNLSQERLCVLLRTLSGAEKWFAFDDDMRLLVPLPALPHHTRGAACAVAAGTLYMIGGLQDERACLAFNPRNNQWEAAASMKIARQFAAAGVIAGQIYVLGGCLPGAESWAEKYDPLTNQWSNIPSPPDERYKWMHGISSSRYAVLHDKLFAHARNGGIIFNPLNSTWNCMSLELHSMWKGRGAVVNNILFCCDDYRGELYGYDYEDGRARWLRVRGWESEVAICLDMNKLDSSALLTNVGGKLYMLWGLHTAERHSTFALTALNIVKQPGMLTGEVIWCHVISCNVACTSSPLGHSVSLAL